MNNVLLIAGLNERYYFEPFINACKDRQISIYICDPSRYPNEASLSVVQDKTGAIKGYIDTVQLLEDSFSEARIDLSEIDIAWYLRENNAANRRTSTRLAARFARNESRQALRAVFSLLNCKWVNQREAIEHVISNKLYQQAMAARCGLSVPKTIVSNDPAEIIKFSHPTAGLLAKTMGYIKLDKEGTSAIYSERFSSQELSQSEAAIRACPLYAQIYVEKRYEHRVMVIGQSVLSCQIDSQASEVTKTDWRHYDFANVTHKQIDLPKEICERLLKFMATISLRYGAIDIIETPEGEFVFLEVNPSGQWGWIADLGGLPIPNAVADMLEAL